MHTVPSCPLIHSAGTGHGRAVAGLCSAVSPEPHGCSGGTALAPVAASLRAAAHELAPAFSAAHGRVT